MAKSLHTTRTARTAGRRSPLASIALITIGLLATGGTYALFTSSATANTTVVHETLVDEGEKLYVANCATCHGLDLNGAEFGPSLIGVGEAAVEFQVATGRMPLAASGPQPQRKPVQFTPEQIAALYTFVGTYGPGPEIPDERYLQADGDASEGAELFRINCAMCHNVAGAGGALTEGKYAPSLAGVSSLHIYEAMTTGPSNMPQFNDLILTPEEKANIITYLKFIEPSQTIGVGGFSIGSVGPVAEGLFIWIFGLGGIVAITVWLTAKSN